MTDRIDAVLTAIDGWGAGHVATAVVGPDGILARRGEAGYPFRLASVTKLATAWAVLIAIEAGRLELDTPAGPPGATVRHLLAHASGLPFEGEAPIATPGRRRIYSNPGYDALGRLVADRVGLPFEDVLLGHVLEPLGMAETSLVERPSQGLRGPLEDLVAFALELLRPRLLSSAAASLATTVAFPGLPGVVPGVGNFDPCDWGLGPELHGRKSPHWMGPRNSPATFGHFGGSGTFLWVDPDADIAVIALTDREYGPWALTAWPTFSDEVLAALG